MIEGNHVFWACKFWGSCERKFHAMGQDNMSRTGNFHKLFCLCFIHMKNLNCLHQNQTTGGNGIDLLTFETNDILYTNRYLQISHSPIS